eukprot:264261_1
MASPFKSIGKRINDFLKAKEYELNRTAKFNVQSDKVNWSLENKLNKDGGIDSELNVSHEFPKDTLSLKTSTKDAPKFEVKTKRFKSKFDLSASVQDPTLELKFKHKREKYCVNVDSKYDWSNQYCDANLAVSYDVNDKLLLGTKAKVERAQNKPSLAVSDYNVGVQYKQNKDRVFALTTENRLQKVKVGAEFRVRDMYQGFAQISYQFNAGGDNDDNKANPLGYSVGVQRKINDTANLRAVYRDNKTASILYFNRFSDQNICAKLAANFDFSKAPAERATIQWKVVFGTGGKHCCKK